MTKNNGTKERFQTGLYWPEKRTEVEKIILPFQTVETVNESKADRDELTLFRQKGEAVAYPGRHKCDMKNCASWKTETGTITIGRLTRCR